MANADDLLALERKFWTGDAEFYRGNLDETCLVAFTEMAGVMSREQVAESVKSDTPRWSNIELKGKGMVQPETGVAILSYEAKAKRADGKPYNALVSSAYVERDGAWKLAFHQQTPLATK